MFINLIKYIKIIIIPPIIIKYIKNENQWEFIKILILNEDIINKINKIVIKIRGWIFLLCVGNEWIKIIINDKDIKNIIWVFISNFIISKNSLIKILILEIKVINCLFFWLAINIFIIYF